MITVIIPTIFKTIPEVFQYTIDQMNAAASVAEIIIINNTCDDSNLKKYRIGHKFKIINDQNYYVNNAWNKGVEECRSKYYLLLNDDILCHYSVFDLCCRTMEEIPELGIITTATNLNQEIASYTELIKLFDNNRKTNLQYFNNQERAGWFIFGRKEQWKPIENMRIYFGDDFIYRYNNQILKQKQARLENVYISHYESTTSRLDTNSSADEEQYVQSLIKYKIKDNRYGWIAYN
jgi:hypothetical protein